MADRNLLLVKDELCPTASFLNWVRLRCQLALIFKYKKDVYTFPQRDSICWNLCNKMGSSDSVNIFFWSFVTIALHNTKARFAKTKSCYQGICTLRLMVSRLFPTFTASFAREKKLIATSAIDY